MAPDQVCETTPIAVTSPSAAGRSFIVAANLHEFLRFGCLRGFLGMQFIDCERYQAAFSDPQWYPGKSIGGVAEAPRTDGACGFGSDDDKEDVLGFLREELGLTPIEDGVAHFKALQTRYGHLVAMSRREEIDALSASLGEGRVRRWLRRLKGW